MCVCARVCARARVCRVVYRPSCVFCGLQTDGDHKRRMVNWDLMTELYRKANIEVVRVPIEDFNGLSLYVCVYLSIYLCVY